MALSAPPPPPETTATTDATTNNTTPRPMLNPFQRPPNPFYSPSPATRLPSNPNPNYPQLTPRPQDQLLYPLNSSARGAGFVSRPVSRPPAPRLPFLNPPQPNYVDQGFARLPQMQFGGTTGVMSGVVKGVPLSNSPQLKVGPASAFIPDSNGHKELRDRIKDDNLSVVRDRKVRLKDNASLYSLCRSWLRNGFPDETQPQYPDAVKSLPRPLPLAAEVVGTADKKEGNKEDEDEVDGSSENVSSKELLQGLVKRAKRVRSRLRDERLQRIDRYKTRLALLLPPVADQNKNETN